MIESGAVAQSREEDAGDSLAPRQPGKPTEGWQTDSDLVKVFVRLMYFFHIQLILTRNTFTCNLCLQLCIQAGPNIKFHIDGT